MIPLVHLTFGTKNRVGESNKTFVLSHHLSRIMYYPEKQVFTIENQVKFGIIFL